MTILIGTELKKEILDTGENDKYEIIVLDKRIFKIKNSIQRLDMYLSKVVLFKICLRRH